MYLVQQRHPTLAQVLKYLTVQKQMVLHVLLVLWQTPGAVRHDKRERDEHGMNQYLSTAESYSMNFFSQRSQASRLEPRPHGLEAITMTTTPGRFPIFQFLIFVNISNHEPVKKFCD